MKRASALQLQQKLGMVAADKGMAELYRQVHMLAPQDVGILITGESGVGKDSLARFIHEGSLRRRGPFVKIDCRSISENLFESEVFGYVAGAFTGALPGGKRGLAQAANHGTLFLDEVCMLSTANQVKLLRFLQSGEVTPVGAQVPLKIDVRVISATSLDIHREIREERFRQDLSYRLCTIRLNIPPLRERPQDTAALARKYLKEYEQEYHAKKILTSDALGYLCEQPWPGNIRELASYVQRLWLLDARTSFNRSYLEENIPPIAARSVSAGQQETEFLPLREATEQFERAYIERALRRAGSLEEAAALLEVPLSTLNRKKKHLGIYRYPRYL